MTGHSSTPFMKLSNKESRKTVSFDTRDVLERNSENMEHMTAYDIVMVNGNIINLPGSVIIPFRDKFKVRQMIRSRPLLLHLMLKQGQI